MEMINNITNGAKKALQEQVAYQVSVTIQGVCPLLFNRWNCEAVEAKAKAPKNSKIKKSDDPETQVWRNDKGELCLPGEYLRQSIIHAAKYRQDPRSPRKSAMDICKAWIVVLNDLASLGTKDWDFLDNRRVVIQKAGITKYRPAMLSGWKADFELEVIIPEYIESDFLHEVLSNAGRLIGVGDFRPTFGRFIITRFEKK